MDEAPPEPIGTVAVFPLEVPVVPGMIVPLRIFEPRYRELASQVTSGGGQGRFATTLIERGSEVGGGDQRSNIGCLVEVVDHHEFDDGNWTLITTVAHRIRVTEWLGDDPFPRAIVEAWPDTDGPTPTDSDISALISEFETLIAAAQRTGTQVQVPLVDVHDGATSAVWRIASLIPVGPHDLQEILSAESLEQRFSLLHEMIVQHLDLMQMIDQQSDESNG